jgi:hypothetical protein
LTGRTFLSHITFDVFKPSTELVEYPGLWTDYYSHSFDVEIPQVSQRTTEPRHQTTQAVALQAVDELRSGFKTLLSNPDCAEFVEAVLRGAESRVPENQRYNMGFEDLFQNIAGQGGYILERDLNIDGTAVNGLTDRRTDVALGNAQVKIRTRDFYTNDPPRRAATRYAQQRRHYLWTAFHETFHHNGRTPNAYLDEALGRAAFKITGDTQLLPSGTSPLDWSGYFDNQLAKKCAPDMVHAGIPPG